MLKRDVHHQAPEIPGSPDNHASRRAAAVHFVEDPKHSDPLAAHDSHKINIVQQGPGELLGDLGLLQEGCEYSVDLDLSKSLAALDMSRAFASGMHQVVEASCPTVRLISFDPASCGLTIHLTADVPKKWTRRLVVKSNEGGYSLALKLVANVLPIGFGTPLLHDGVHVVSHSHSSLEDDNQADMR